MKSAKDKIEELRDELHKHNYFYYIKDRPIIDDYDFDMKLKELINLENQFPQYYDVNSPTQRVGGRIVKFFNSVKHQFPMYSLDNSYSKEDLILWTDRLHKNLNSKQINYLCELKFDGVSINLTYENGFLTKAVTRGDGVQGDDVTENIKTIKNYKPSICISTGWLVSTNNNSHTFVSDVNFNDDGTIGDCGNTTTIPSVNIIKLTKIRI